LKAVLYSVYVRKLQCSRTQDAQACDDAGMLSKKGLTLTQPKEVSADDWKTQTKAAYTVFHSAIALDDAISKKDFKGAVAEFTAELMLYTDDESKTVGLNDTLQLAQAYTQADAKDLVKAIWFYARAWDFAPANFKPNIEKSLNYYYKKYHGDLKGLDDIKAKAALTTFPGDIKIEQAKTPAEIIHDLIVSTPDLNSLALADKETVLSSGTKEDAEKLWAVVKGQLTPVPGLVMEANASALKVTVTVGVKPTEIIVALNTPVAPASVTPAGADMKANLDYIVANGVKEDADKVVAIADAKKVTYEPLVGMIKVAVTQDAKDAKTPDFIVNLKTPVSVKEAPAVGSEVKTQPAVEIDGTYDTYTQIPATATTVQSAQIVLKDAFIQAAKKAPAAPAHKPAAGHRAAAH
jgi:hypothetical protein